MKTSYSQVISRIYTTTRPKTNKTQTNSMEIPKKSLLKSNNKKNNYQNRYKKQNTSKKKCNE